jgi:ribosomal protein S14
MKISIKRNQKRRVNYSRKESKFQYLHWILFSLTSRLRCNSFLLSQSEKKQYKKALIQIKLQFMHQKADFSISKIRNTCYISRRSRGVSRAFRLSRMSFKEQMQLEYFTGVTRFPAK